MTNNLLLSLRKYKWLIIFILVCILWILLFYLTPDILGVIIDQVKLRGYTTITTKIGEMMDVTMYLSTVLVLLILIPLFSVWGYTQLRDAMYENERRVFNYYWIGLGIGYLSIILGYIFSIYMMVPFFVEFNSPTAVLNFVSVDQLITFIITNVIIMFVIVQVPIIMRGLCKLGIVSKDKYKEFRLLYFCITLVIVAWITPLDLITTILFQLPVYGVYELGILLS